MKNNLLTSIRLTLVCLVFFVGIYPFLVWIAAQAAPNHGDGELTAGDNRITGFTLEGQNFSEDRYFWGRPSAVGYNADRSGGSNKGTTDPAYLNQVKRRIDSFLRHNPAIKKEDIPSELVTASGSGLDPDISPAAAFVQVARIAATRHIDTAELNTLIIDHTSPPLLGLFGPRKLNVLQLNRALDDLK